MTAIRELRSYSDKVNCTMAQCVESQSSVFLASIIAVQDLLEEYTTGDLVVGSCRCKQNVEGLNPGTANDTPEIPLNKVPTGKSLLHFLSGSVL